MQKLHVDAILYKGLKGEADANPGPGQHDVSRQWIKPTDTSISKTTPQFSFSKAPKNDQEHFNRQVFKQSDYPGPGSYATPLLVPVLQSTRRTSKTGQSKRFHTQSFMTNNDSLYQSTLQTSMRGQISAENHNAAMSKIGNSLTSTIRQDRGISFGKAQDRFKMPTQRRTSPAPTAYTLPDTIGIQGERASVILNHRGEKKPGVTVFGRENRSKQFDLQIMPKEKFMVPGPGNYAFYTQFDNDEKFMRSISAQASPNKSFISASRTVEHSPRNMDEHL